MESIKAGIRQRAQTNQLLSLHLSVFRVEKISPGFTRVVLSGPGLDDYRDPRPADAFKLMLPPGGGVADMPQRGESGLPEWSDGAVQPVLRAFTVREFDATTNQLAVDVARHGQGVSIDWLAAVRPGDPVSLAGMRPEWAVAESVADHVLVGDGTAVPAIAAIVESLDATHTVSVYVALPDPDDSALLPSHPNLTLRQLEDVGDVVRYTPPSVAAGRRAQVWVAAEAGEVRRIRNHVVHQWGVDRNDLLARAYWKLGTTSTDSDSASLVKYQEAAAQGADIHDPALAESIDLGA